ncbi:MAG TPA: cytochrome d ubiquinol oxidase subunit II [Chlamydiales bacterium]|nr:cytochrome d ubiquinol oxidase subunit II [Chlamydiales bacterium]
MIITTELLQILVYIVFVFSIVAYATLDGFDLGVGSLHLFAKGDNERRLMINAIGPVWDGNTTWIVIGAGVLFAGFPKVFYTIMAGFYTLVMVLLFAFMLRGAAIEFRSKQTGKKWRNIWDFCFFFSSLLLALDAGIILGNLIQGVPLNLQGEVQGGFSILVRPYPILIAFFALSIFLMHGSIYLLMKTEGHMHNRIRIWVRRLIVIFLVMWAITTVSTFMYNQHMVRPFFKHPVLCIFGVISICLIAAIPYAIYKKKDGWAFIFSCCSIFSLLILFAIGTFPNIIYSTIDPDQNTLTLFNSSVTRKALVVLVIVALSGTPLAIFYGSYIHKVFKGKVKLDHMSY